MVSLLRRREMMQRAASPSPTPTLIYELASATSTASYDTGVKLFDPAISFTILCDATFANRSWSATQTLFGIGTGFAFALGSRSGNDYVNGVLDTSNSRRYTALIMNNTTSDTDAKKMTSLLARFSNSTEQTHRFAIRYNATTFKVEGFDDNTSRDDHAPTSRWYNLDSNYSSQTTVKFFLGNATGTINIFKVYDGLLTDAEINNFLDKISD